MDAELRTVSSVSGNDALRERVAEWVLFAGDRKAVAGCLVVVITGVIWALVAASMLAVGPDSSVAGLFRSGLTSGIITLVTIALSINQLVLSRVFGSISKLSERHEGSRELRRSVESIAGVPSSPTDPAGFLSLVATTLTERARGLVSIVDDPGGPPMEFATALRDVAAYGESIDEHLDTKTSVNDALSVVLGTEYALNITAVQHLRNEYAESIPEEAVAEFEAIEELLQSIAVVRQFYKTMAIQQDLATLSRLLVYSGVIALVSTIIVALTYRTSTTTIPEAVLPIVVSVGIGVVVTPLALFVSYVLRAATVARQTVSVGPFVPPGNQ